MPKQRKVFAMQNFLGLDKENKPLKVAPFRASDGYNFEIDSQTLKTRKAFVVDQYIKADMATGDSVVEWYEYQGITFYVTKETFYVVNGDTTIDLKTNQNVVSAGIATLNNTDKNPIFREEKNALFVFGLDAVLVFSMVRNNDGSVNKYVFYDLATKPANPYQSTGGEAVFFEFYQELPIPYEPTLFIGNTAFEDVNLLSKVSKYRLFANQETVDGYVKYFLPTHFDPEKNGNTQTVIDTAEITFYQNAFDNLEVYPIFLGIDGENFDYTSANFGDVYNTSNYVIEDTFFPNQVFEFYKDYTQSPAVIGDTITKIYALKKEDFFILRMKDTSQSVFEYLLNLIKIDGSALLDNQVVKFNLPVEYTAIYRPDTDYSTINEKLIEKETIEVYVQLRKFDSQAYISTPVSSNIAVGTQIDVLSSDTTAVAYPSITGTYDETIELDPGFPGVSINNTNFLSQATTIIQNWVDANKQNYLTEINNDPLGEYFLKIQLDMYFQYIQQIQRFVNVDFLNIVNPNVGQFPYPSYPSFTNPENYPVQNINDSFSNTLYYPGQEGAISNALDNFLTNNINSLFGSVISGFGIVTYQYSLWDYNFNSITYVAAVGLVEFQKQQSIVRHIRNAATAGVKLTLEEAASEETLYNLSFNQDKNWFELEVRDYFYDYNNEPSIDVKFTFPLNPDYEIISKNKFGIFFGSEDRLFLAGHPDYPNIDRYNVSNDLLGNNVANQSYELSYFPSRNYRVLGGKGRINGYVVATDTQLYVTKEDYPNDSKLFIRERVLDENGLAFYKEFKTSVTETPLNEKCLVRFYNDILILTKNGLYGVEISSNVLTNERLLKLRSGYINKYLKGVIAQTDKKNIFIVENNQLMFIFVGKNIFVADSRYISKNENSEIENLSYELVQWTVPEQYVHATFKDNVLLTIAEGSEVRLELEEADEDIVAEYEASLFVNSSVQNLFNGSSPYNTKWIQITNPTKALEAFNNFSKSSIYLPEDLENSQIVIKKDFDIAYASRVDGLVTFNIQNNSFRPGQLVLNETLVAIDTNGNVVNTSCVVKEITDTTIKIETSLLFAADIQAGTYNYFGRNVSFKTLYPVIAYKNGSNYYFKYSLYKLQEVFTYDITTQEQALKDKLVEIYFYNDIYFDYAVANSVRSGIIITREPIVFLWQSVMTDFGNNLVEKTIYRANVYATKKTTSADMYFGYKTMRRFKSLTDTNIVPFDLNVDISNLSNFDDLDFTSFAINTFEEFGMSLPMKENNFLYIQFIVKGQGRVELNAFELIYKDNRRLKSIG
jgi:hypothetical protein